MIKYCSSFTWPHLSFEEKKGNLDLLTKREPQFIVTGQGVWPKAN